jgi:hypothetical protein
MKINLFHILMICVFVWFCSVAIACSRRNEQAHITKKDGTTVSCKGYWQGDCGMYLKQCSDGHEYNCVQNVEYY